MFRYNPARKTLVVLWERTLLVRQKRNCACECNFGNNLFLSWDEADVQKMVALPKNCYLHIVDSFRGQEVDLVIMITTRTGGIIDDDSAAYGFFHSVARINVALSHSHHGLFVVADFQLLLRHGIWDRFLMAAMNVTLIVLPACVDYMDGDDLRDEKGFFLAPDHRSVMATLDNNKRWK